MPAQNWIDLEASMYAFVKIQRESCDKQRCERTVCESNHGIGHIEIVLGCVRGVRARSADFQSFHNFMFQLRHKNITHIAHS